MLTRQSLAAFLLAVSAISCGGENPTEPIDPLDVRVYPAHVFAGGEVVLSGNWYRDTTRTFSIAADTFNLPVRRINDSTIAAQLPTNGSGPLALKEHIESADVARGTVVVHGLKRAASVSVIVETSLTPLWSPVLPYVVTGDDAGVSVLNLRTDGVTRYAGVGSFGTGRWSCPKSVGPTYRDHTFLLWTAGQEAERWDLIPDTLRREHIPLIPGCAIAEVSPLVFVRTDQQMVFLDSIDPLGNYTNFYSDVAITNDRFFRSPTGAHFVVGAFNLAGAGIIDLATRSLAYRVPAVTDVIGAAFSSDGQRLFLCGQKGLAPRVLIALDAMTGDSVGGFSSECEAVTGDTHAPLLYVLVTHPGMPASVEVFDQVSLARVGSIDVGLGEREEFSLFNSILMVDRAFSDLIIVYHEVGGVGLRHLSLPPIISFPQVH